VGQPFDRLEWLQKPGVHAAIDPIAAVDVDYRNIRIAKLPADRPARIANPDDVTAMQDGRAHAPAGVQVLFLPCGCLLQ
jgi:hypothetical protein